MANEKRLIYADEVIELINGLESLPWEEETEELVISLTAVDAVEVVRCKDCLFKLKPKQYGDLECGILRVPMKNDDFCSYGERREG